MPTGYTADVQSGKITEFNDFVWLCARGMSALIMMRDAPWGAPIPERFEPETAYYDKEIAVARARLDELRGMSPLATREAAQQAYAARAKEDAHYQSGKAEQRKRYEAMLSKVQAWEPPTQDHTGLKNFMAEQLASSIDFDCSPGGFFFDPPKKLEPAEWHSAQVAEAMRGIEYHTAERAKEVERTESRNRWLAELRASLAEGAAR